MESSFLSRLAFATFQGSAFLLVVWLICLFGRRLPAKWKCWLWRLVPLKFLLALAFVLTIPVSMPARPSDRPVTAVERARHAVYTAIPVEEPKPVTIESQSGSAAMPVVRDSENLWGYGFGLVWLLGIAVVLGRDIFGSSRLRNHLRLSASDPVYELPKLTSQVFVRSGYWAPVRVRTVPTLTSPALTGLLHPTILLPKDFENRTPDAISSAVAHELAHLHRKDLPWVYLANLARALFWFDPLIWLAYREQRAEAEIAADQLARNWSQTSPKAYAEHLLEWIAGGRKTPTVVAAAPGMLLATHELTRRINAMQKNLNPRRSLILGGLLFAPLALGLAPISLVRHASIGLADSAWPKFRGGLTNTGRGGGAGATATVKWSFANKVGFDSSPAIGPDGTLYEGSWDGNLYALDGTTGKQKWQFKTSSSIQSSPAVGADGTVYVGSWDGWVYALDGEKGNQKWTFETGNGVYASPTIGPDGTVYIGSEDGAFYALYGATGVKKWACKTGDIICSTPAIGSDGTVYFGSNDQKIYALDGATGRTKWTFDTGGWNVSSPALGADGTVYVGSSTNALFALDGATGKLRWTFHTKGVVKASPAIGSDGTVYVGCFDHNFYAVDGAKGTQKWVFSTKDGFNSSAAIGSDGTIYVGAWDHNLYALDGSTGAKKWAFKTGDSIGGSPVIAADGTVYFGAGDKHVYALK